MSRRKLLAGGAALGVAAPVAQHMMWSQREFSLPGYDPTAPPASATSASWMNWSGSQKATPAAINYPVGEAGVQDLVRTATGRVRPVGSGHSFTGLARSDDMMVDLAGMDSLISYDPSTGHATFGAGTKLFHAAAELNQRGRAFANLPDIDVQTLAGSFATGTHGTGNQLTALHDYIESFRLVTANGDVLDVSRNSHP
ncbi:MAG: FAD-binding protein, partial [Henriciella sp.]